MIPCISSFCHYCFFFKPKILIYRSNLNVISSSFLQTIPSIRVEKNFVIKKVDSWAVLEYSPSAAGAARSPPAMPHLPTWLIEKGQWSLEIGVILVYWTLRSFLLWTHQNGRCLEGDLPLVFWHCRDLLINKFLDPRTPSMRKVDNKEKKKKIKYFSL